MKLFIFLLSESNLLSNIKISNEESRLRRKNVFGPCL
jgi:hypothetical protein